MVPFYILYVENEIACHHQHFPAGALADGQYDALNCGDVISRNVTSKYEPSLAAW